MMKIALCYHGILGSSDGKGGVGNTIMPHECFPSIEKHIRNANENCTFDVFAHSWSVEHSKEILDTLRPKRFEFEKQKIFAVSPRFKIKKISDLKKALGLKIRETLFPDYKVDRIKSLQRHYSRWYSAMKSISLMEKYQRENGIEYDFVMLMRYDVEFYTDLKFNQLSNNYFYASNWNDLPRADNCYSLNLNNNHVGHGFLDLWFISNPRMIIAFAQIFDMLHSYDASPHLASYQHVKNTIGTSNIRYILYRWVDYEMIRAKKYGCLPPHISKTTVELIFAKFMQFIK